MVLIKHNELYVLPKGMNETENQTNYFILALKVCTVVI